MVSINSLQTLNQERQETLHNFYNKLVAQEIISKVFNDNNTKKRYSRNKSKQGKIKKALRKYSKERNKVLEKYRKYETIQGLGSKIIEEAEYLINNLESYVEGAKSYIEQIESLYKDGLHGLDSNKMSEIKEIEDEIEILYMLKIKNLGEIKDGIYKMIKDLINNIEKYDAKYNKKFNNSDLNKEKEEYFTKLRNLYDKCKFLEQDKKGEENFDYIVNLCIMIPLVPIILGGFKHIILDREKRVEEINKKSSKKSEFFDEIIGYSYKDLCELYKTCNTEEQKQRIKEYALGENPFMDRFSWKTGKESNIYEVLDEESLTLVGHYEYIDDISEKIDKVGIIRGNKSKIILIPTQKYRISMEKIVIEGDNISITFKKHIHFEEFRRQNPQIESSESEKYLRNLIIQNNDGEFFTICTNVSDIDLPIPNGSLKEGSYGLFDKI